MPNKPKLYRAGFGPHCVLRAHARNGVVNGYSAKWCDQPALTRDGETKIFASESFARAWLAAADVTNGATARPI